MRNPRADITVMFDHQIFASQVHGGISRYFAALAANLPDEGVTPRIIAPIHINGHVAELPVSVLAGVRVPAGRWSNAVARRLDALAVTIASRVVRPKVAHETYYADRRRTPAGVPVVLTVYDMIHEIFPGEVAGDPTSALKRSAIARADRIICISESTRRDLVRLYPDTADRAVVTLLGFDPHPLADPPPSGQRPYILYVGLRSGYKNFGMLLDAYAHSRRLKAGFDLVCVGGGRFTQAEEAAIAELGSEAGCVRHIAADDQALQRLYRGAAVFVYPSLYEGFGIPPLEAMAQHCPVVCLAAASIPEVCGQAAAYAEDASAEAIRTAIEAVLDDPARADMLRAAGVERLAHFSWRRCAAETATIYRDLV